MRRHVEVLVDPHRAGFDTACHVVGACWIRRPYRCAETVGGCVSPANHILAPGVFDHRQHRPELLFVDQVGAFLDVAHYGRFDEVAGTIHCRASGNHIAVLAGVFEEGFHLFVLHLVLQRPKLGALLGAVIDHSVLGDRHQLVAEPVIYGFMHIEALDRKADLPEFWNAPSKMPGATFFGSTSSSTMPASLPPSSSVIRFSVCAALAITFWPVADDPVKEILRMSGCLVMCSPRSLASVMTLSTPLGRMSLTSSAKRSVDSGVVGAGFTTSVFPASSAEGNLKLRISSG